MQSKEREIWLCVCKSVCLMLSKSITKYGMPSLECQANFLTSRGWSRSRIRFGSLDLREWIWSISLSLRSQRLDVYVWQNGDGRWWIVIIVLDKAFLTHTNDLILIWYHRFGDFRSVVIEISCNTLCSEELIDSESHLIHPLPRFVQSFGGSSLMYEILVQILLKHGRIGGFSFRSREVRSYNLNDLSIR